MACSQGNYPPTVIGSKHYVHIYWHITIKKLFSHNHSQVFVVRDFKINSLLFVFKLFQNSLPHVSRKVFRKFFHPQIVMTLSLECFWPLRKCVQFEQNYQELKGLFSLQFTLKSAQIPLSFSCLLVFRP